MLDQRHKILLVPVQLSQFVYDNNLNKSFAIYLYLKLFAGDKISADDELFDKLKTELKMRDPKNRTFRKHFKKLLDENWIGFNPTSGIYHIRSFDYVRAINGFKKRRATKLFLQDLKQIQIYLVGVIINAEIYAQKYYWERVKRKPRTVTKQRGVTNQSRASFHPSKPKYYGICNRSIAKLLNCKYTRACTLKNAVAKAGYLTVRHRYKDFIKLRAADFYLRPMVSQTDPAIAKRLKFWRKWEDGVKYIQVVQQLHDEIIPQMQFKRVTAFAALKVPFGIIKGHFPLHAKAA